MNETDKASLVASTRSHLKPFAGSAETINRLRNRYTVVLTILSWENIVYSSRRAKVERDGILSCEFLGYYKPSLEAYLKAVGLLGLKPPEAGGMMQPFTREVIKIIRSMPETRQKHWRQLEWRLITA